MVGCGGKHQTWSSTIYDLHFIVINYNTGSWCFSVKDLKRVRRWRHCNVYQVSARRRHTASPPGAAAVMFSYRPSVVYVRARSWVCVCACVYVCTLSLMSLPFFIVNKIIGFFTVPVSARYTKRKTIRRFNRFRTGRACVVWIAGCKHTVALRWPFERRTHKSEPCRRDRGKCYSFFVLTP